MSHRLPASGVAVLLLLGLAVAFLTPAAPAAGYGEKPYEGNTVINNADLDVFRDQSVAQSFVAAETYRLLNVTLRLRNTGSTTDPISIYITPDSGGRPATNFLDSTQVVSPGPLTIVNVPFSAAPIVTKGLRYWIVATHPGLLSDSYRWYHSNSNTYAGGWAMYNLNLGSGWLNVTPTTDMYFTTFGRESDANVSLAFVASPYETSAKDLVTFTAHYNNTGTLAAGRVWINTSMGSGMTYVSDNASGSATAYPNFSFDDVANGVHSFTIMARVGIAIPPGTQVLNVASLAYANGTGSPRPGSMAQAPIVVGLEWVTLYLIPGTPGPLNGLTPKAPTGGLDVQTNVTVRKGATVLEFDLAPPLPRSFRGFGGEAVLFLDSRSNRREDLDMNLTVFDVDIGGAIPVAYSTWTVQTNNVDDFEAFSFPFPAIDRTFAPDHWIRLRVRNEGTSSDDAHLAVNSTAAPSRLRLMTSSYVHVDSLLLRDATGPTVDWSPLDPLIVRANVSDPLGTGRVLGANVRIAAPDGTVVANAQPMSLLASDASSRPVWRLFEFALPPPLAVGSYDVEVTALGQENLMHFAGAVAAVRAPSFGVEFVATESNARSGDRYLYIVYYNNTGGAPAGRAWLNVSIPAELIVLGSSDPANQTGPTSWTWSPVGVGSHRLDLQVEVRNGTPSVPYVRTVVSLEFVDQKGHAWPARTAYVDVALNGPVIAFSAYASRPTVHANETVTFTFLLTNSGDLAQSLWLNDTLPVGLDYISNDAGTLGAVIMFSGGTIRFLFGNLPAATTWSFNLVARGASGVVPGTVLTNRADLNFTNANGSMLPPQAATAPVVYVSSRIAGSLSLSPAVAIAGDRVLATVDFANDGNEASPNLWLNLTLGADLTFRDASLPASMSGTSVRFTMTNVAVGSHRVLVNLTLGTAVDDGEISQVAAAADHRDGVGNPMPSAAFVPGTVVASEPRFSLSLTPGLGTVEAGASFRLTIFHDNAGSGTAGDVWLNISLPAPFVYVSDDSDGNLTRQIYAILSWHWEDRVPGSRSFNLDLSVRPSVASGDSEDLLFRIEHTDANGNWRARTEASVHVDFVAPSIDVDVVADRAQAAAGEIVAFTLNLRNFGTTPARTVWLMDAVDARFEIVSYNSRVRAEGAPNLTWTFADVLPGQEEIVLLTVRVRDSVGGSSAIANVLEAVYTNSEGIEIGYQRSTPVTILVPGITIPTTYLFMLGASALGFTALVYAVRRRGAQIEEVFLVYRDGVLIYHISRSLVQDRDEDVLSGMLTAVQEFVRDAFRYGEHRQLHQLDFGDYRILIERGETVYLAVVYSGPESPSVRRKVRAVLGRVEGAYAHVLANWNGDMDQVVGARDIIRDHLLRVPGQRAKPRAT